MNSGGYLLLYRSVLNHWVWPKSGPYTNAEAWIYLLCNAAHSVHKVNCDGKLVTVQIGEILTSTQRLSDIFGWGWRRTERFLKNLEKDDMISRTECTHLSTCLKITNYADLQGRYVVGRRTGSITCGSADDSSDDELVADPTWPEPALSADGAAPINNGNQGVNKESNKAPKKSGAKYSPSPEARGAINHLSAALKRHGAVPGQFDEKWFFSGCRAAEDLLKILPPEDVKEAVDYLVDHKYYGTRIRTMADIKKNLTIWQRERRTQPEASSAEGWQNDPLAKGAK